MERHTTKVIICLISGIPKDDIEMCVKLKS